MAAVEAHVPKLCRRSDRSLGRGAPHHSRLCAQPPLPPRRPLPLVFLSPKTQTTGPHVGHESTRRPLRLVLCGEADGFRAQLHPRLPQRTHQRLRSVADRT